MFEHADVWNAVDSLVDRAPSLDDLRDHRLHLLAERRWLETGRSVPGSLTAEKALAAALFLPVPILLARVRSALTGRLFVLKGPEVARRYPDGSFRTAGDIDLLVEDTNVALATLRAAGFVPVGDPRRYVDIHHVQPLVWPGLPVRIELHHSPKWIDALAPPSPAELFARGVPADGLGDGIETLDPAAHALVLAVHAWAHEPLGSLRDLIDIAIVTSEADAAEIATLARRWGVFRVWRTTRAALEALFAAGPRPVSLRIWARHLEAARGRTVAESHVEALLSPFWALPPATALKRTSDRITDELRPIPGELWRTKLARARLALRHARVRKSLHERAVEEARLATPPALFLDRVERRRAGMESGRPPEDSGEASR